MKVAGREHEIKMLQNLLLEDHSEFAAVYGRRRIGKTYLIRQVFENQIVFDCSGLHELEMSQQLENFWIAFSERYPSKKVPLPQTWLQAFTLLRKQIKSMTSKQKKVIFLDEIAWFETPKSGFLAALDNFWNQFCTKRNDIILVICGSAASWIIDKIINNRGGLHNRITTHIPLMPFTLGETKDFLSMQRIHLSLKDIATLYMCVGGVPFYLKDIKVGQSVPQILDELYFSPKALLKNEFGNLYASLFKNSDLHVAIVKALATKNKGLTRSELLEATKLSSGGGFSLLLQELVECGFVKSIYPINKAKEDILYRLVDEYSIFYFKFIENRKGKTNWAEINLDQKFKIWSGYAFENLCFNHVFQIKKALGIHGIVSNEYSWVQKGTATESGTQIDFIIDRSDNCISILELKFYDRIFEITAAYAQELREKVAIFKEKTKTKKNVFVILLTAYGAKRNEHFLNVITNDILVDELYK